jgi:hypothetical protein
VFAFFEAYFSNSDADARRLRVRAASALSRDAHPEPLIRVLDRAQQLCAELDWSDLDVAERQLTTLHAFDSPDSDLRLRLLSELTG